MSSLGFTPEYQDYVAPARVSERKLLGTLWAGVAVSFCFLLFRFYVRLKIFRRLHVEDPFVLAAWFMNLANAALWQKTANELYAVIAVDNVQRSLPPLHSIFTSYLLYYTALWSIKLSFLLFFRKLGIDIRRQRIFWYCVLGYTVASYIICLGTIDYKCLVEPGGLAECRRTHAAHYTSTYLELGTVFDTTTDALIILVSTNLLWNASVELRKKLALTGIFCLIIFIISVSIIRIVLTTDGPLLDLTWLLLWSGLEMTVAIVVACVASFRILYTRSERSRRSGLNEDRLDRATRIVSNGPSIPLNARLVRPGSIIASENTRHKRHTSTVTFEEAILPMDDVYPQHNYSVLAGPRERYEEIRSPRETPVVRLYSH